MERLIAFLRDPLAHFLLAGLALFLIFQFAGPQQVLTPDAETILVDREQLLTFVQYRTRTFEPKIAAARLSAMSEQRLKQLIDDYVREESLHREALALGLGNDDYVIRRRLVQKMEYLAKGAIEVTQDLPGEYLQKFFEDNKADYFIEPMATFTHVFFDAEKNDWDEARRRARETLILLNTKGALFTDAPKYGDVFLYQLNYVERTSDYVASHFGDTMTNALFILQPDDQWHGPYESPYGSHVVMLSKNVPGRYPVFEEIEGKVTAEAWTAFRRELTETAVNDIVGKYKVQVTY